MAKNLIDSTDIVRNITTDNVSLMLSDEVNAKFNNAISLSYTIMLNNGTALTTAHAGGRIGTMNTTNNTISWRINAGCVISPFNGTADQSWGVPVKIVGYKTPIL